jgi:hypothetical protein
MKLVGSLGSVVSLTPAQSSFASATRKSSVSTVSVVSMWPVPIGVTVAQLLL